MDDESARSLPRIWATFSRVDDRGRVLLNSVGSLKDIEILRHDLQIGERVRLYNNEREADAVLEEFGTEGWAAKLA